MQSWRTPCGCIASCQHTAPCRAARLSACHAYAGARVSAKRRAPILRVDSLPAREPRAQQHGASKCHQAAFARRMRTPGRAHACTCACGGLSAPIRPAIGCSKATHRLHTLFAEPRFSAVRYKTLQASGCPSCMHASFPESRAGGFLPAPHLAALLLGTIGTYCKAPPGSQTRSTI